MTTGLISDQPHVAPARIEHDAADLAVIRHEQVTLAQLPELFDPGFTALGGALAAGEFQLAGPALAVYHGDPQQPFDLEIGFPIAAPLTEPVESAGLTIQPGTLPAGTAYALSHVGSYDGLGAAWGTLMSAVVGAGAVPTLLIEIYLTQPTPEVDPTTLRTDLVAQVSPGR